MHLLYYNIGIYSYKISILGIKYHPLMYSPRYKHLSDTAKLAYMVLKDRLEYSLRNHWMDENNHVYFVFTNQELKDLFDCSNDKLAKVKHELEQSGLLFQRRMSFNPNSKRNEPNRLYLAELEVEATDVYRKNEEMALSLAMNGLPKNGHNLDKELITKDYVRDKEETRKLDFSTANYSPAEIQNQDLIKNAADYLSDPDTGELFLNHEAVQLLTYWCHTPQQLRRFIGIILNAKNDVEKEHRDLDVHFWLADENLQQLIRRYFNALRSDEKRVKSVEGYLYGTIKNMLAVYWNKDCEKSVRTCLSSLTSGIISGRLD